MAKKTKKQTRKVSRSARSTELTRTSSNGSTVQSSPATVQTPTAVNLSGRMSGAEFNPDYSQTIKDLKRIGVLAGSFFMVLIIISFFLR
jgi:hypothetical protein